MYMHIIEQKNYYQYTIGESFISGFTKPFLAGVLPDDIQMLFPASKIAFMDQEHGDKVLGIESPGRYCCDGIFTSAGDLILVVKTADCMPLLFFSEKEKVTGAVHMGWRSAEKGILDNIDVDLKSFTVIAGPGMRKCCYEVGEEFAGYHKIEQQLFRKNNNLYFDPVLFAKQQLTGRGLNEDNFIDSGICTLCSAGEIPSYRKTGTGNRTLSFIAGPGFMDSHA